MHKYHHFEQNQGELRMLPYTIKGELIRAVGTFNCQTCLCVYVQFENHEVFIAHMVVYNVLEADNPESGNPKGDRHEETWHFHPQQGQQLKAAVMKQLQNKIGDRSSASEVRKAFVVCPEIFKNGQVAGGWWMKEAVREFFKLSHLELCKGHGFVAGPSVNTVLFHWEDTDDCIQNTDELLPGHYGWEAVNGVLDTKAAQKEPAGPWEFQYYDGEWHSLQDLERTKEAV